MTRSYAAFISYRHEPLSMAVAKRLHTILERYHVPRALRRDGEKRLGLVFRDLEELPLSADLSADIYSALDNSERLIVICTPETPKSKWVRREIEYFIKQHGHERVLVVLASGTPETSFPPELLARTDADGLPVEPLAANVCADTEKASLRKLKRESLRLIASLLSCPYDELAQRGKRYKRRVLFSLAALTALVAAGFIGLLLTKNADITTAFRAAQRDETRLLTAESQRLLQAGDRLGAVRAALDALPETQGERPYDTDAERALADALYAYQSVAMRPVCLAQQESAINAMTLSADGRRLFTMDGNGCLRCFNAVSGSLVLRREYVSVPKSLCAVDTLNALLYQDYDALRLVSMDTGEALWAYPCTSNTAVCLSEGQTLVAYSDDDGIAIVSARDGATLARVEGAYPTAVSSDGTWLVCLNKWRDSYFTAYDFSGGFASPQIIDLYALFAETEPSFDLSSMALSITDNGDLYVLTADVGASSVFCCSLPERRVRWAKRLPNQIPGSDITLLCGDDLIIAASGAAVWGLDAAYGDMRYQVTLEQRHIGADWYDRNEQSCVLVTEGGRMVVVLADGAWLENGQTMLMRGDGTILLEDGTHKLDVGYDVREAAAAQADGLTLAVIPSERKNQAVIHRAAGDKNKQPVAGLTAPYFKGCLSPSGEYILCADEDNALVLNARTREIIVQRELTGDSYLWWPDALYLTDTMDFIIGTTLYPAGGGTTTIASSDPDCWPKWLSPARLGTSDDWLCVWVNDKNPLYDGEGCTDSVHCWLNGTGETAYPLPEPIETLENWRVSGNGYVLIQQTGDGCYWLLSTQSGAWTRVESRHPSTPENTASMCLAQQRAAFAVLDPDNVLRLYDIPSGKTVWEISLEIDQATERAIVFCLDDRAIMVLVNDTALFVSAENGALLGTSESIDIPSSTRFKTRQTPDDGLMLYMDFHSGCSYIDTNTFRLRANIPDFCCYLPLTDEILVRLDKGKAYAYAVYPRYSLSDLIRQGRELLETE